MTTDGTFVYAQGSNCGNQILRFDPVTTSVSLLPQFVDGAANGMVVGPDKALYATAGYQYIDRKSLLDGSNTRLATLPISGSSGTLSGIAADGSYLYVLAGVDVSGVENQQLYKVNVTTGAYTTIGVPTRAFAAGPLTLAGARLYAGGWNHDVISIDKTTGAGQSIAGGASAYADGAGRQAGMGGASEIVSDGTSLFVADASGSRVRRIRSFDPGVPVAETYGESLLDTSNADGGDDSGNVDSSLSGMPSLNVGRADPVNTATGAFTRQETDVTLPGAGTTFNFTRTYTSVNPATGRLGTGWTDPYQSSLSFDGSGNATYVAEDGATIVYPKTGATWTGPQSAPVLAAISGGYTVTTFDQRVTTFNSAGQMTKAVDAHGKGLTFGYTGTQQTSITDNAGRTVTLGYTGALLTSLTLPDGRHVDFGYTGIVLTSVRNLGGHTTTLNYDSAGYLNTEIDPKTNTMFTNTYDDATGRVTSQIDATGSTTTFGWTARADPGTGTATTTAPDGGVTTDVYSKYVLVQSTDPAGGVTKNSYDINGQPDRGRRPARSGDHVHLRLQRQQADRDPPRVGGEPDHNVDLQRAERAADPEGPAGAHHDVDLQRGRGQDVSGRRTCSRRRRRRPGPTTRTARWRRWSPLAGTSPVAPRWRSPPATATTPGEPDLGDPAVGGEDRLRLRRLRTPYVGGRPPRLCGRRTPRPPSPRRRPSTTTTSRTWSLIRSGIPPPTSTTPRTR